MPQNAVNLTDISCPETGMIFCDPVTFANPETGTKQVYERVMLLHWYKLQNMHCPYDNEIPTDDQIVKDNIMRKKIDSFIAENPKHIEAIRYRKYHDKEANWRKHHTSQDPNAFAYDQIKQYRTNCYNSRAQKTGQILMASCLGLVSILATCQYFALFTLSAFLSINLYITGIAGMLFACLLWMWPEQTESLKWLIGSSITSVPLHECRTLESIWNPESTKTHKRFQSPCKQKRESDQGFVQQTLHNQAVYALSFAQLVLGCPDLQMFNTANEYSIPTQKIDGKEVPLLDRNTRTLADYHTRKEAISKLKTYTKSPEKLAFPNSIPLLMWPIRGLLHMTNGALKMVMPATQPMQKELLGYPPQQMAPYTLGKHNHRTTTARYVM